MANENNTDNLTEENRQQLSDSGISEKESNTVFGRIGAWYRNNTSVIWLVVYDLMVFFGSFFVALWVRYDCNYSEIPMNYKQAAILFIPLYVVFAVVVFHFFRLYNSIWKYASYSELGRLVAATIVTCGVHCIAITLIFGRMPIIYYLFGTVTQFVLTALARFMYRFIRLERARVKMDWNGRKSGIEEADGECEEEIVPENVMLIGAGDGGQMIARELNLTNKCPDKVRCFIDDDPGKKGKYLEGVKVVGGREEIMSAAVKYKITKIIFAIPSMGRADRRDILNICSATGCKLMELPGLYQLANGQPGVKDLKDVKIEDLLGRDVIQVDNNEIFAALSGKTIMVTGGGGSIGSELVRQIAAHAPGKLIIFDIYENNAYAIEQELKRRYPHLNLVTLIGSVRDSRRLLQVFSEHRPEVVFHAAAHKHVPLMETSPCEAIKNNAVGTYKTAYAAMANGCERFVLISTDKAVNPTNVMGATKRVCEMIIQAFDRKVKDGSAAEIPALYMHRAIESDVAMQTKVNEGLASATTEFVAVRFGNVLGSNGSVVPLFKQQIEEGGPVTVTHPDLIRYFMTIPEAVSLVLQASVYAKGGEIFVLDMGDPVKIDDLARNLIRLAGHKPDVDIKIIYTGLRPGEKLYEEKLMAGEGLIKTRNELIYIGEPLNFDTEKFFDDLADLYHYGCNDVVEVRKKLIEITGTYKPDFKMLKTLNVIK